MTHEELKTLLAKIWDTCRPVAEFFGPPDPVDGSRANAFGGRVSARDYQNILSAGVLPW